ncbi:hypothetical protein T10_5105 [Trichinella papuae]|uniref:Uncharacterized protein n=1 Tax=Trichinella papuae TaxID=268474 RepID=A0A0V1LY61_9BILA|nr:hypothetical protein T10_5105 [Trichinella papuae]
MASKDISEVNFEDERNVSTVLTVSRVCAQVDQCRASRLQLQLPGDRHFH